ncbi:MAG: hypothetical protein LUD27_04350 [Clostridia bacterium]|nr:hypothetical protein [Clostridia bacterium]
MSSEFENKAQKLKRLNRIILKEEAELLDEKSYPEIDALLTVYKHLMPETVYLIKNKERYPIIMDAINDLIEYTQSYNDDTKISIKPDELIGTSLFCEIETVVFSVNNMSRFLNILKEADTIEVCPLTNGNVSVCISFKDAFVPAPPRTQ